MSRSNSLRLDSPQRSVCLWEPNRWVQLHSLRSRAEAAAYEEVDVKKSRLLVLGVTAAAVALVMSGCAASGAATPKAATTSKASGPFTLQIVQTTPSFSYLPLDVIEHATGATNNLTISTTDANGGAAASQLFSAGTGQLLVSGGEARRDFFRPGLRR